jgi:multiple sugar transport system ATP-binding protein
VAGFIGSPPVNLIPGRISQQDGVFTFSGDGLTLPLPPKWNPLLQTLDGADVIAGIRPDTLVRRGTQVDFEVDDRNSFSGKIQYVEPLLGETILGVEIGHATLLAAALQEMVEVEAGDQIELAVDLNRVMLFDSQTEKSLMTHV